MKSIDIFCSRNIILVSVFIVITMISGCTDKPKLNLTTEYQAVFLDNGQAFIGILENPGSAYPTLKKVFYIQSQMNQQTKEVKNVLIKRGSEWHEPDHMIINSEHIVLIEPVSSGSKVAQLIKDAMPKEASSGN